MSDAVLGDFVSLDVRLRDGRSVTLRSVRADDGERLQDALRSMSAESRYARFMFALRDLSPQMLARAIHPDAERELQLIAVIDEGEGERIVGGARYAAAPGSKECEFAIAIINEWHGKGLARPLLETLMRTARARGFERMDGYILASNSRMLTLAKRLGFAPVANPEDPGVCLVARDLTLAI